MNCSPELVAVVPGCGWCSTASRAGGHWGWCGREQARKRKAVMSESTMPDVTITLEEPLQKTEVTITWRSPAGVSLSVNVLIGEESSIMDQAVALVACIRAFAAQIAALEYGYSGDVLIETIKQELEESGQ